MTDQKSAASKRAQKLISDVSRLQLTLIRHVNDTHIFLQQALPLLMQAQKRYSSSQDEDDRAYVVPSHKKLGKAFRSDEELKEIYERFIDKDLYNNLLVAMVSRTESFLFDVLRLVLHAYPKKITVKVSAKEPARTVDADVILNAVDLDAIVSSMIEDRINALSFAKPSDYLKFLKVVAHINTSEEAFSNFVEIKATRDVIVHNAGSANKTYCSKSQTLARAKEGKALPMNEKYFDDCLANIKRLAGIVKRDVDEKFSPKA